MAFHPHLIQYLIQDPSDSAVFALWSDPGMDGASIPFGTLRRGSLSPYVDALRQAKVEFVPSSEFGLQDQGAVSSTDHISLPDLSYLSLFTEVVVGATLIDHLELPLGCAMKISLSDILGSLSEESFRSCMQTISQIAKRLV